MTRARVALFARVLAYGAAAFALFYAGVPALAALACLAWWVLCAWAFACFTKWYREPVPPPSIHERDTLPSFDPPEFDGIAVSVALAAAVEWAAPVEAQVSASQGVFIIYYRPESNALITDEDLRAMDLSARRHLPEGCELALLPG